MKTKTHNRSNGSVLKVSNSGSVFRDSISHDEKARERHQEFLSQCMNLKRDGRLIAAVAAAGIEEEILPADVRRLLAEEIAEKTTVKMEGGIPVWMWAHFQAASKVNKCASWESAMIDFMSEHICEWSNDSYFLLNNRYVSKPGN